MRNPSYDPATDDPSIRPALPDGFDITVNTNRADIFARIARGQLEGSFDAPPATVIREEAGGPAESSRLRINAADKLWYLSMNLTEPPFDDVHVRRAMNSVMDLDGLRRTWGGPVAGEIATDVLPDSLLDDALPTGEYHPFQDEPFTGDPERAKEEMRQSRYDTDGDGLCDAAACSGVLLVTQSDAPWKTMAPVIVASAARIGIDLDVRAAPASASYDLTSAPGREVPFAANGGWFKDYADPIGFMVLFDSRTILPAGNNNWSLVGLTAPQAKELGIAYPAGGVPSVNADIDRCSALAGQPTRGLLARAGQAPHRGRRALGALPRRVEHRPDRSGGHGVRLRPVLRGGGAGTRRRRPRPAVGLSLSINEKSPASAGLSSIRVEDSGFEPLTSWVRSRRSPN